MNSSHRIKNIFTVEYRKWLRKGNIYRGIGWVNDALWRLRQAEKSLPAVDESLDALLRNNALGQF